MRLNLPNYHCVQFELFSHFSIPLDKEADVQLLMNQTRTRDSDQEDNTRAALFVSQDQYERSSTSRPRKINYDEKSFGLGFASLSK